MKDENKQLEKHAKEIAESLVKEKEANEKLQSKYDILKEHEMNIITI